ncbi:hypothetical protein SAICODRAFT_154107 [Saitoella complicata NRRL Y-17804]|uniref:Uncharacterized protein n=1 Tax=Saitoella complicata (strain BCRC 22490 / CBS 7301 / JCM 7358 / NBRC 10748 / NRRL Y-17804) TaxID=698492 RepID=A0A0E9NQI7_SAICN|nr:uncharacterized protein SAICODRAFT_154107 [Saitoella complicata NRRL Y-17804]ODQ51290.1 hypothetical protein SAICODRAFT_154107 [Saitoella complicata NRRL Y-17804]GAO51690.1 hypothetical protein G7K_5783-t1 [Saitoella complicata NRRL Y-17804]
MSRAKHTSHCGSRPTLLVMRAYCDVWIQLQIPAAAGTGVAPTLYTQKAASTVAPCRRYRQRGCLHDLLLLAQVNDFNICVVYSCRCFPAMLVSSLYRVVRVGVSSFTWLGLTRGRCKRGMLLHLNVKYPEVEIRHATDNPIAISFMNESNQYQYFAP